MTYRINASKTRSIALAGLMYVFTTNQLLCCFDALALPLGGLLLAALPYNGVIQTDVLS